MALFGQEKTRFFSGSGCSTGPKPFRALCRDSFRLDLLGFTWIHFDLACHAIRQVFEFCFGPRRPLAFLECAAAAALWWPGEGGGGPESGLPSSPNPQAPQP